jgi:hypothetical protein
MKKLVMLLVLLFGAGLFCAYAAGEAEVSAYDPKEAVKLPTANVSVHRDTKSVAITETGEVEAKKDEVSVEATEAEDSEEFDDDIPDAD